MTEPPDGSEHVPAPLVHDHTGEGNDGAFAMAFVPFENVVPVVFMFQPLPQPELSETVRVSTRLAVWLSPSRVIVENANELPPEVVSRRVV